MKIRVGFPILFAWLMLIPAISLQADEVRDELAQVVRLMGYGGGIHNFKNYVLRGREEYRSDARANFLGMLDAIAKLERSDQLDESEKQALNAVKTAVESYEAALDWVADLHDKGWRIEDIDRVVIIDDTAALQGLDMLRSRWTWTDLEQIEYQLGYGKGIHNFKNYVLRGRENYHTEALQNLLTVEALLTDLLEQPELKDPQTAVRKLLSVESTMVPNRAVQEMTRLFEDNRSALENVQQTAQAYRDHLDLIERLIAVQRSVRQIDLAVKINDGPAKAGLAYLKTGLPRLGGLRAGNAQTSKP